MKIKKQAHLLGGVLPEQALVQVAQYFAVLAEPRRLMILNKLSEVAQTSQITNLRTSQELEKPVEEKSVGELAAYCGCSQANISRHLSALAKHGIVIRESRGTTAYYRIADASIYSLCNIVFEKISKRLQNQADVMAWREETPKKNAPSRDGAGT